MIYLTMTTTHYFRVVQKNLVFVIGLSPRLADPEVLKKNEYFGKFGRIYKVVINNHTVYNGAQVNKNRKYKSNHSFTFTQNTHTHTRTHADIHTYIHHTHAGAECERICDVREK